MARLVKFRKEVYRATDAQKKAMDNMGIPYPPNISKSEAHQLIQAEIDSTDYCGWDYYEGDDEEEHWPTEWDHLDFGDTC